jgi:hypothetical protein
VPPLPCRPVLSFLVASILPWTLVSFGSGDVVLGRSGSVCSPRFCSCP